MISKAAPALVVWPVEKNTELRQISVHGSCRGCQVQANSSDCPVLYFTVGCLWFADLPLSDLEQPSDYLWLNLKLPQNLGAEINNHFI